MTTGIYHIKGENGTLYYGSAIDIEKRWSSHKSSLCRGNHDSSRLQNAYNKHGISYFSFDVVEVVEDKSKLLLVEQKWLNVLFAFVDSGDIETYNSRRHASSFMGCKHTEETKQKLRMTSTGNTNMLGKKHSEETRRKLSLAQKGKVSWNKGKTFSDETKIKLSIAHKGKMPSDETRKRMSESAKHRKRKDNAYN